MNVTFDEPTHTYRLDGAKVPSVTQCLQLLDPYKNVDRSVMEAARQFGRHGHKAMWLLMRHRLQWETLDPALVPYIEGGAEFLRHLQGSHVIIATEHVVAHSALKFAGTIDLVIEDERQTGVCEFKFTAELSKTVGPQSEAYSRLLRHNSIAIRGRHIKRLCVTLTPGGYSVELLDDPGDWPIFMSCLNVTKWKMQHGVE